MTYAPARRITVLLVTALFTFAACRDGDSGPTAAPPRTAALIAVAGMLDGVGYTYSCEDEEFGGSTVRICTCDTANEVFFYSLWSCLGSLGWEADPTAVGESSSPAVALLRQEKRAHSAEELDAFADRLVEVATRYREGDAPERQRLAIGATEALVRAATGDRDNPYSRSFGRLARIVEDAQDPGIRLSTLARLTRLPEVGPVATFLGKVAASSNTTDAAAGFATSLLLSLDGEAGHSVLRRLFEAGAVSHPAARVMLDAMAYHEGWDR